MKLLVPLFIPLAVCLLSHCSSGPPPAPGDTDYKERLQSRAYRSGYHRGFTDGGRGPWPAEPAPADFERYHDEYKPATREAFSHGYEAGFIAGGHQAPGKPGDEDHAYQNGYDAGQGDAQNGTRPDHRRYQSQFAPASESSFREGYAKGYQDSRKE